MIQLEVLVAVGRHHRVAVPGLEAELVIARKLEDGWERPLEEWRQELRLNVN